jgi:sterol 3beta-glucosyltransferase
MAKGTHCTILALGSRGDIQPLLALSLGLRAAGYTVRFAAPQDFENWVRSLGLDYVRLTGNSSGFFSGAAGMALRDRIKDKAAFQRFFEDYLGTYLNKLFRACWEASQDTDAIFCWPWTRVGPSLAERLRVPLFVVSPNPVLHLPTSSFANPFQGPGALPLGPLYNRLSWLWATPFTRIGQRQVDAWRKQTLGLEPLPWREDLRRLRRLPHLFGYSPAVLPKPWDWGRHIHVTGYWFLDQEVDYRPPADLEAFLAAGEPPVAIGFSSQVGKDSKRITAEVVEGLRRSGQRGLFISGWGGVKGMELPEHVHRVDTVPYDWLLPRISAMVHQGGSGSVAAVLRAGVPSFAVPFGYEQALWGQRIAKLGVGIAPLAPERLNAHSLAGALKRLSGDTGLHPRALELAERIKAEQGLRKAVDIIERALNAHPAGTKDLT